MRRSPKPAGSPRTGPTTPWDLWIDTGGTFTDCLARDPAGRLSRLKVLSTGALRGRVAECIEGKALVLEPLPIPSDAVLEGLVFRSRMRGEPVTRVVDYDSVHRILKIDDAVETSPGSSFELTSLEEAPVLAARLLTGTPAGAPLPPLRMRLATTRATNALLERKGSPVALFVTKGFGDLLTIGTQQRPDLFTLRIQRPESLQDRVIEAPERLAADGSVLIPLDAAAMWSRARALRDEGITVAAVSLLHGYLNDVHERELEDILRSAGFSRISRASALAPAIHYLHRTTTTVVNAYLSETLTGYVERIASVLRTEGEPSAAALHLMTSTGGLVAPAEFQPKDSLLSGPAAGVVGAAGAGRRAGFERVIAFDMGGTSTDVSRFDGDFDYAWKHRVGSVDLLAPALAIETVAAGGGSICSWGVSGLTVGPESAGASPGPACYGAGGPLTLTDCNLLLGRIDSNRFGVPIDVRPAEEALQALRSAIERQTGERPDREALLAGLVEIADERMADAIRAVSVRKGYDPSEYALIPFGGAGAQHACAVARRLGMDRLIIPRDGGLLSAIGLGEAVFERIAERQVLRRLSSEGEDDSWLEGEADDLGLRAAAALSAEGFPSSAIHIRRRVANMRFVGQETTLAIELTEDSSPEAAFHRRYVEVYGHVPRPREIEVESLRVVVSTRSGYLPEVELESREDETPESGDAVAHVPAPAASARASSRLWTEGSWREVPRADRDELHAGASVRGPCVITDPYTSIIIEAGWSGHVHPSGAILLRFDPPPGETHHVAREVATTPNAVRQQLFTSRFEALVDEMGEQLRRTAISTNVKERLDYSCALLDAKGELVANAPHIPVHLGALGLCVRTVAGVMEMRPGDVVVTNHPAFGGSHLPDVTVISPVHSDAGELVGYVANRAHHAEIGGTRPGSMPPRARSLVEEGVVVPPFLLVRDGHADWEGIGDLFAGGPYPSRSVEDNLADLRAQAAANHRGAQLLRHLVGTHGAETVREQMDALTRRAERSTRAALARLGPTDSSATERLDDGSLLSVRVRISPHADATIDFDGTSGVHPGNLNATPAVVRSAVLYVLRLLVDEPIPLNEGMLRPIDLRIPPSLLAPDFHAIDPPAVVGGNTEVSQRLVDTLLKALSLAACSQGTMNNVLWGNARFGYYETLAGGEGASPGHHGQDAVQLHMTNTRITDAEILEHRYPVRVERFAVRSGSGGTGQFAGGDGVVREITFLRPMDLSVLTQHRRERPYGMAGGSPGAPGAQRVVRASGETVELEPIDGIPVEPGDRLVIETPGGGAWGVEEEGVANPPTPHGRLQRDD